MTDREIKDLGDFYERLSRANTDLFVCWYDYEYVVKSHGDFEAIERKLKDIEKQIQSIRNIKEGINEKQDKS